MVNLRFTIVTLSWLLIGASLVTPAIAPMTPNVKSASPRVTAASTQTIILVGYFQAWNATSSTPNPTITVTQGDIVSITLSSGDTMHQFALDVDKDGPKFLGSCPVGDTCSNVFTTSSGTSISITTASLAPGTYTYFCTFHSGMVGSFVVLAPPSVPGGGGRPLEL